MKWLTMCSLVFCLCDDGGILAGTRSASWTWSSFEMKYRNLAYARTRWLGSGPSCFSPGMCDVLQQRGWNDPGW